MHDEWRFTAYRVQIVPMSSASAGDGQDRPASQATVRIALPTVGRDTQQRLHMHRKEHSQLQA